MSDIEPVIDEDSGPALVLEYNELSKAIDISWLDPDAEESGYVTSIAHAGVPTDEEMLKIGNDLMDSVLSYANSILEAVVEEDEDGEYFDELAIQEAMGNTRRSDGKYKN